MTSTARAASARALFLSLKKHARGMLLYIFGDVARGPSWGPRADIRTPSGLELEAPDCHDAGTVIRSRPPLARQVRVRDGIPLVEIDVFGRHVHLAQQLEQQREVQTVRLVGARVVVQDDDLAEDRRVEAGQLDLDHPVVDGVALTGTRRRDESEVLQEEGDADRVGLLTHQFDGLRDRTPAEQVIDAADRGGEAGQCVDEDPGRRVGERRCQRHVGIELSDGQRQPRAFGVGVGVVAGHAGAGAQVDGRVALDREGSRQSDTGRPDLLPEKREAGRLLNLGPRLPAEVDEGVGGNQHDVDAAAVGTHGVVDGRQAVGTGDHRLHGKFLPIIGQVHMDANE